MMQSSVTVSDDTWKTPNFRQNMASKIEEAIQNCGSTTSKSAVEMESQLFSKAKSKDEYLSFVARLIIHISEMGYRNNMMQQQAALGQPQQQQQFVPIHLNQQGQSGQPILQVPIIGVQNQNNMGIINQVTTGMMNMSVNSTSEAFVTVSDDTWATPNFRQNMVSKIEEAIQNCGQTTKTAVEMESQVFSKAKGKDEYLSYVARLIIHLNEMGFRNNAAANLGH